MSPHPPEYMRLCGLLEDSLQPFSDIAANCLSDELEKDVLVSLSKVVEHVRNWAQQLDSDEELLAESIDLLPECSILAGNPHCLEKVIGDLISLLAVGSQYVQHLVSNTLIAISVFLIAFGYGWDDFMNFLCLCLELAICNTLSPSSVHAPEARFSDYDLSYFSIVSLKQKLRSANWSMGAGIFRVLRGILKNLKQDTDEEIMKVYLSSVSSLILNVPWDLLADVHLDGNTEAVKLSAGDVSLYMKFVQQREVIVFFGHFIQVLCSLVKQASLMESEAGISLVICKVTSLVPILVAWFHTELQSPRHVQIFHYFRHKVLMLMIKLHSHIQVEDIIILSWLHLLHQYFEDLLLQPISKLTVDNDSALEDLPFCASFVDQKTKNISSCHLQRLTIFMFLRCSLHLISMKECSDVCSSENLEWYFTSDQKFSSECCSKSKGLLELRKWLQAQMHSTKVEGCQLYFYRCIRFTSSFLQLFMHEDDLLFEILLQMFHLPFSPGAQNSEVESFLEVQNEQVFHVSDLFNPVYLFHLFLAEILYDHQVLLDYLISNVTGSNCAEYLLRSLRHACDSWTLFIEFPGVEEGLGESRLKRQKVESESGGPSLEMKFNDGDAYTIMCCRYQKPFVEARDCLVSLRESIDSLNQKNLFPYNPRVLLRRLMRFEELCMKEENS